MKRIKLFYVFSLVSLIANSQDAFTKYDNLHQNYFLAPEVKSFLQTNLTSNDMVSGKIGLTLPLYEIRSGRLRYPIQLSYNSGGVNVNQESSEVGLNWSISKSVIIRKIMDGHDFDNKGSQFLDPVGGGFSVNSTEHDDDWNWSRKKMGYLLKTKLNFLADPDISNVDDLPDIFTFLSADGYNTKFYLKNYNTIVEMTEKESLFTFDTIKKFYNNPEYASNSFYPEFPMRDIKKVVIKGNNGIEYTFEHFDVSITRTEYLGGSYYQLADISPQVSAWHISKIEDIRNGDKIEFEYQTYNPDPINSEYTYPNSPIPAGLKVLNYTKTFPHKTWLNDNFIKTAFSSIEQSIGYYSTLQSAQHKLKSNFYTYTRFLQKNKLTKIKFNKGVVVFNWSNRQDLYGDYKLDSINVYNKKVNPVLGNRVRKINFNYGYFSSNSGCRDTYLCKRLKLKSLILDDLKEYSFNYYDEYSQTFPNKESNRQDLYGYYSSNVNGNTDSPDLYFYPNKKELSLLPFNIPYVERYRVPGTHTLTSSSLEDVRKWTLSSIKHPTGILESFEYELNDVNIFNQDVITSGLRLKENFFEKEGKTIRKYNYLYKNEAGKSSGVLTQVPIFGKPNAIITQSDLRNWNQELIHETFTTHSIPAIFSFSPKSNLLYNRVTMKESGNGYVINHFTTSDEKPNIYDRSPISSQNLNDFTDVTHIPNYLLNNSSFGSNFYLDNSFQRRKLLKSQTFNESGDLLKEIINVYSENSSYFKDDFTKRLFFKQTLGFDNDDYENVIDVNIGYKKETLKLVETTEKNYFNEGTINSSLTYTYNQLGLLSSSSMKSNENEDKFHITNYVYGIDTDNQSIKNTLSGLHYLSKMLQREVLVEKDNNKISLEKHDIAIDANGFDKLIRRSNKSSTYFPEKEITRRDNRGNILEYINKQGQIISLIYGYGYSNPIARVENASYAQIASAMNATVNYVKGLDETDMYLIDNLRNKPEMKEARITTYTYKPLVGITRIRDERGRAINYEYDDYNRLEFIKDQAGNIIEENKYNYKD